MNPSAKSILNRIIIGTVLLSLGAIVGVYLGIRKEPVWISLFNGQDLEGWEVKRDFSLNRCNLIYQPIAHSQRLACGF